MPLVERAMPIFVWAKHYNRQIFRSDLLASMIVSILLIPQSMAYALLAGLPAEVGLYSTILPLIVYAIFGSSRALSVAPMAIASLMTAVALADIAEQGSRDYLSAAILLAFLSGVFLMVLGKLKLGFLANFLSYPVISGFITASAIIIALSQFKHLLGITATGSNIYELGYSLFENSYELNIITVFIGFSALIFLFLAGRYLEGVYLRLGMTKGLALALSKASPLLAVLVSISAVMLGNLDNQGVALVGSVKVDLPSLTFPVFSLDLIQALIGPAILISIIGYVESVAIAKKLAATRQQKIDENQELLALGAANIASSFSSGFPVAGSLSRTKLNFNSGAVTQAASIYASILVLLASITLTPILYFLPKATLAAIIVMAVTRLVDFSLLKKVWNFNRNDFYGVFITLIATLFLGVELGLVCGVSTSIFLLLYRTSKPHIAEVGLIGGTQYFKNINRHKVKIVPQILSLRVDESLYFANAGYLEAWLFKHLHSHPDVREVILMCSAVNEIDYSALAILESINKRLENTNVSLNLSEVKGPVMDSLKETVFVQSLSGNIYLSQFQAYSELKSTL